eukprot:TRINITY_DN446_c0_g1_i1.p1 TRINITY_DN446_c0_g1~~TRINITY_DN446_c0_g1_i1.p1  ORF type:complete len:1655 (+),score=459.85 TRINITY_DN446_c0_g1_i1:79-5043(+)
MSSEGTTEVEDDLNSELVLTEEEEDSTQTTISSPLLRKTNESWGKSRDDLSFLRKMRKNLEKKITSGLEERVSFKYKKTDSEEDDETISGVQIIEMERLYRLQQKYYFVSLQDVTYTVEYTSAADHQATLWNTLPPVLFWKKFISKSIQTKTTDILKDVTFFMKPGSMTLLLGAPGSGKTTLFNIIADRLEKPRGKITGEVKFNGISLPKQLHQRDVGYVTQRDDVHLPRLTVEETLRFATECQLPGNPPDYVKRERIALVMSALGIEHRAGSLVGDDMLRGISGGEKRRLSIAVEYTKIPAVTLYDSPTNGLDAYAALHFTKILQSFEGKAESCLASLLQPSYEIFCLFENVLLLSQGEVAFFGGRKQCLDFFEERGYVCDLTVNPADFLQEVVENPKKYRASKELREQIKQRVKNRRRANRDLEEEEEEEEDEVDIDKEYTREDFIADWNRKYKPQVVATINAEKKKYLSKAYLEALKQNVANNEPTLFDKFNPIKTIHKRQRDKLERLEQERIIHYNHEKGYAAGYFNELYLHVWRSSVMMYRNQDMFTGRLVLAIIIGLLLGSLFWNLPFDQRAVHTRGGLLFFLMSYSAFTSLSFLPLFTAEKKIFYFQKAARYFRTVPYHIGCTLVEIPITLAEAVLMGGITYWMTGLNSDPSRFFFFLFLLFIMSHLFSTAFKFIGIVFSSLNTATTLATTGMCVLFLMSGFTIPVDSIRPYFIWLYWISPFHYAWEGLMINELNGQEYYCKEDQLVPSSSIANFTAPYPDGWNSSQVCPYTTGLEFLQTFGFWGNSALNMRWADIGVLIGTILLVHIAIILSYMFIEPSKPRPRIVEEPETRPQDIELRSVDAQQDEKEQREGEGNSGRQAARFIFKNISYSVKQKKSFMETISRPHKYIKNIIKRKMKDVDESYVENEDQVKQPGRLSLLTDVSGEVLPGQLVALMGASGAGKSTLLDVLARRKTSGKISGDILINGQKMNKYSNRIVGYVEQQDIHIETSTVREALEFSAACRLAKNRTKEEKKELVTSILSLLDLEPIQHRTIATLSQEQKKRVTIGVEMAADPVLLFLDEPTSGLDSRGAEIVMKTVRRIVDSGRASVVCTIHQPSAAVFELFTHLLLLKKGGRMVYFGEIHDQSRNIKFGSLFKYFSDLGLYCPPHRNPADWMLDITSEKSESNYNHNNNSNIDANDNNETIRSEKKMNAIKNWMGRYKEKQKAKTIEKRKKIEAELRAEYAKMQQQQQQQSDIQNNDDDNLSQRETEDESSSTSSKGKGPITDSSHSNSESEEEEEAEEVQNILRTDEIDPNTLDFTSIFSNSTLYTSMITSIDTHMAQDQSNYQTQRKQMTKKQKRYQKQRYASSFHTQLFYSYLRSLLSTWRDPFGVQQRILTSMFLGLLFGLLFLGLSNSVADTTLKVSLIYFSLLFTVIIALSSLAKIISERSVFYRERSSMTYRTIVYLLVLILSELPFLFLSSITFCVPVYWLANLNPQPAKFFIFVLGFTLTNMAALGFIQVCTVLAPDVATANTIVGAVISAYDLFAGFLIARNLIPNYWIWMNYVSFLAYPIEALSVNELKGARIECRASEWVRVPIRIGNSTSSGVERLVCPVESGEEILASFGLKEERMWIDLGVMAGWWVCFLLITLLALKFVKHIKR